MHIIELLATSGSRVQHQIIYRSKNYKKAERLFLRLAAEQKPVALVSIGSLKQITSKEYSGGAE